MTRTAELTAKLLDGTLSDAECAELESLISADPGAEAEHLALLELEVELRGLRTDFDLTDATLATIQNEQTARTADAVLNEIAVRGAPSWAAPAPRAESRPESQFESGARRRGPVWVAVALVACAAAVLGLWLGGKQHGSSTPDGANEGPAPLAFAKLTRKTGLVEVLNHAGDVIRAEEGGELPAGFILRTGGDDSLAVIELLRDRASIEIEPDSVVRFTGDAPESAGKPRMYLAAGQLTAAVPLRADGALVVGTPVAEVSTRGATFVISSAGPESARVDIKQGKVELVRAAAPKPVAVFGGAAVVRAGFDKVDIEGGLGADRTPKRVLAAPGTRDVTFSPDGAEVWVASARGFGRWLTDGGFKEIGFFPRKNDGVAAITRDRRFLLTFRGERDDRVLVRTLPDCGEHTAVNARPGDPRQYAVAPDASWLATVDPKPNTKLVRVFDVRTGAERFVRDFENPVACLAAAPDGTRVAAGVVATARGDSNKVIVLDVQTSDRLGALPVPKRPPTAMTFSPDSRVLAVGFNGAVQLWDVRPQELIRTITGFERVVTCLAYSPDGKRLAAGTQDGHVWVWDTATGRQTQLIETGGRAVRALAFSPNGKQLVTVANNAPVALWDVTERAPAGDIQ
jgi:hypothetical protein